MNPQRTIIEAAEYIFFSEIALNDNSKKPYRFDVHEDDWNAYKDSDEYKELKKAASFSPMTGPAKQESVDAFKKAYTDRHPLGYHAKNAVVEVMGNVDNYKDISDTGVMNKISGIADHHFNEYKKTMATPDHPVAAYYSGNVEHHREDFDKYLFKNLLRKLG